MFRFPKTISSDESPMPKSPPSYKMSFHGTKCSLDMSKAIAAHVPVLLLCTLPLRRLLLRDQSQQRVHVSIHGLCYGCREIGLECCVVFQYRLGQFGLEVCVVFQHRFLEFGLEFGIVFQEPVCVSAGFR